MNLYVYDEKRKQIFKKMGLGSQTDETLALILKIIDFIDRKPITDENKRFVLAKGYTRYGDNNEFIHFND